MVCKNCGAQILPNHKFCGECGAKNESYNTIEETSINTENFSAEDMAVVDELYSKTETFKVDNEFLMEYLKGKKKRISTNKYMHYYKRFYSFSINKGFFHTYI